MKRIQCILALGLLLGAAPARAEESALVRAMKDEVTRSQKELALPGSSKPYFIAYRVTDYRSTQVAATFGAITDDNVWGGRTLDVEVRVGTRELDNTNFIGDFGAHFSGASDWLPIEDDYATLRRGLWLATDKAYKASLATLAAKQAAQKNQTRDASDAPSFSDQKPLTLVSNDADTPTSAANRELVKRLSEEFRKYPEIQSSKVELQVWSGTRALVTSEGTVVVSKPRFAKIVVSCRTQAKDGMPLKNFAMFSARSERELPDEAKLRGEVSRIAAELVALGNSPPGDDYEGPVLFEGIAAPELIGSAFGVMFSGTPMPTSSRPEITRMVTAATGAGALEGSLEKQIASRELSVEDDPTRSDLGGIPLLGAYAADDEGVPAERVVLISNGVLKNLLMSRTPQEKLRRSNGHGRARSLGNAHGSIGNLVVTSTRGKSAASLRSELLRRAKAAGYAYGMVVRKIEDPAAAGFDVEDFGGLMSGMMGGKAWPLTVVVRVHPDGKEELVRGLRVKLPEVRALKEIVAVGSQKNVLSNWTDSRSALFSGMSSGGGPAGSSIVSPDLLFEHVELKKIRDPGKQLPKLPHPYFSK